MAAVAALRRLPAGLSPRAQGLVLGGTGVLVFSLSFPATKWALDGFSAWFVAFGRAALAAALGGIALRLRRPARPTAPQVLRLGVVAGGVVVGFPLLSSIALETTGSAHGAIVVALLPAATAVAAVVRAGERPTALFWLAAGAGVDVAPWRRSPATPSSWTCSAVPAGGRARVHGRPERSPRGRCSSTSTRR